MKRALGPSLAVPALLGTAMLSALAPLQVQQLLEYRREAVDAGQVWRLLTGSLVHTSWNHALLNAVGLAVMALVTAPAQRIAGIVWVLAAGTLVMTAEHLIGTHAWARGLSGALYATLVPWALVTWRASGADGGGRAVVALATAFIAGKAVFDAVNAAGSLTAEFIGAPVLHQHHLYGLALGVGLVSAQHVRGRSRHRVA